MTSEQDPLCQSGLERKTHEPLIPSRSSSISRSLSTGNILTLTRLGSAASSTVVPLPQHTLPSTTKRHSLIADSRISLKLLKDDFEDRHLASNQTPRRSASCAATARKPMNSIKMQRWSGLTRTVSEWDHGLRRDPELWYEDGDCDIHLHARGTSRRGPSFCIPFRLLRQKKCNAMLSQCDAQLVSDSKASIQPLRRMPSSLTTANREPTTVQLFIPAPEGVSRENSFKWHITTRNFFAFLLGKPLVGEHMGQAFVDLQERLHLFRPSHANNHQDFLDYADNQGYRDLVECTDYALASLFYAEHFKLRDVWVDAFAHCVGMNDSLVLSPEFTLTSRLTKALITRAHLEVELHLSHVSAALGNFLKKDLSPTYLGLTDGARSHLDRFRRFLHTFFAEKFEYWPPPRGATFPKALYKSMYYDFKNLYDYLVDIESTTDISTQKPASGGICVLQNVANFDKRHKFTPQPHPLPLLPTHTSPPKRTDSQRALRQLTLASQHNKTHQLQTMSAALLAATNALDESIRSSKIVQAYMHFERVHATNASQREEKITATDARKIRWLLIYGMLQYLVSALQAPKEVRDSETADYPLCWVADQTASTTSTRETTPLATPIPQAIDEYLAEAQSSPYSVQPDCQREDYFTSRTGSRPASVEIPAPLNIGEPQRQSSIRSFRRSLSRGSSRKNSVSHKPHQHCAIIVHGYGDGLIERSASSASQAQPRPVSSVYSVQSSILPDGAGPDTSWLRSRTPSARHSRHQSTSSTFVPSQLPLLDLDHVSEISGPSTHSTPVGTGEPPSRSDSTSSTASSVWSEGASAASSKSSACGEHTTYKTSTAEESGLLGGLVSICNSPIETPRTRSPTRASIPESDIHPLLRQSSRQDDLQFNFNFNNEQPLVTHDLHESSDLDSIVGMAVSTPSSPGLHISPDVQPTFTAVDARTLISDKRPYLPARSISIDSAPSVDSAAATTTATATTSVYWERYRAALTQQKDRSNAGLSQDATPPPMLRYPTAFKVPSFRSSKPGNEEDRGVKREKRLSSLWRR